jgi:choline dehydrogenase-like flavoprotein
MGTTKHTSVVDPRGGVWGTDNLYVADAVSCCVIGSQLILRAYSPRRQE